jgi:uncharacterized Zn finger protein
MISRMDRQFSTELRFLIGHCPLCAGLKTPPGVIYRRSPTSITMRCEHCGLQWTMTWLKIHQAAKRKVEQLEADTEREGTPGSVHLRLRELYTMLENVTAGAVPH